MKSEPEIKKNTTYYIYILLCADGTYYTGITTDLDRRLKMHHDGTGAKYTRGRGPFQLKYSEKVVGRSLASKREREIKKLPLGKKRELVVR